MSFSSTINFKEFVDRGKLILEKDASLIDSGTPSNSLVTKVLAQEPPIEQSPDSSVMPVIFVAYSKNPIRRVRHVGRDSLNEAGPKYHDIEFYNVIIANGINKQAAQEKVQLIAEHVKDAYQKNLRMINPSSGIDPICANNEVVAVPYVLRSNNPNVQAINVICRPEVPINLV